MITNSHLILHTITIKMLVIAQQWDKKENFKK